MSIEPLKRAHSFLELTQQLHYVMVPHMAGMALIYPEEALRIAHQLEGANVLNCLPGSQLPQRLGMPGDVRDDDPFQQRGPSGAAGGALHPPPPTLVIHAGLTPAEIEKLDSTQVRNFISPPYWGTIV